MLILLEGMDKTGKSTVAELLRRKFKCDYMHMSAPARFHTRESYFAEIMQIIALTAGKNMVIDRTWYGELVWPQIYDRLPKLDSWDIDALTSVAQCLHKSDVKLIYMYDDDREAHQARLREFKEPSYNYEKTVEVYEQMASNQDFEFLTYPEAVKLWT